MIIIIVYIQFSTVPRSKVIILSERARRTEAVIALNSPSPYRTDGEASDRQPIHQADAREKMPSVFFLLLSFLTGIHQFVKIENVTLRAMHCEPRMEDGTGSAILFIECIDCKPLTESIINSKFVTVQCFVAHASAECAYDFRVNRKIL